MPARDEQFEAILTASKLKDETKNLLRAAAKEDPGVMDAVLRQAEFDRGLNEMKAKVELADKWAAWEEKNLPTYDAIRAVVGTHFAGITDPTELKTALEKAITNKEITLDDAQLAAKIQDELKKSGLTATTATNEQIAAIVNKQVTESVTPLITKQATDLENKFLTETLPSTMEFTAQMIEHGIQYQNEYGKKLDRIAFTKFMSQGGFETVDKAYEAFTQADRLEKEKVAEVEKARQEERAKLHNQAVPGSSAVPDSVVGPVVDFMSRKPVAADAQPAPPAAMAAAAELRSLGKV